MYGAEEKRGSEKKKKTLTGRKIWKERVSVRLSGTSEGNVRVFGRVYYGLKGYSTGNCAQTQPG